jgi:hypothetical protein
MRNSIRPGEPISYYRLASPHKVVKSAWQRLKTASTSWIAGAGEKERQKWKV